MSEAVSLGEFASMIEGKEEGEVEKLVKSGAKFQGYTVMMIAAMHTNGTWVLSHFSKSDPSTINEYATETLSGLADTLQLDVDENIRTDTHFTPLMLAVMFGPPASVKTLLDAGAATGMQTKSGYTAKMFSTCRNDESIQEYFKGNSRKFCSAYWGACSMM
mmetsp:Transcript_15196/g.21131  ORF Transcript_15196/g.21131 Transcript_15196/m.21131 type:complete len:161 (+) Transcript_15196:113-595(+)|eukprot:CAMPEP_0185252962 /NCGR_PEP_ID=MMETSP1359-20130426/1899_1 /TAXON_ID=552665 /ORGANISM="Bigelowiella longifila, Strain CCMP242" /LENGTH=160 /DNA_ID=CAMNT_0027835257 /DNA_START=43 /DNA_END=525 /DNA_ORIENTATION=+